MTTAEPAPPGCLICAKHRGEGPLIGPVVWQDECLSVSHRPVGADGNTVLGYPYVETRRHVPYLDDLNDAEAEAIARTVRRVARGLRVELAAAFVYSAIIGTGIAHFHQHLFARNPGTPASYDWMAGDQWPDAPRGSAQVVAELCGRLRRYLQSPA